MNENKNVKRKKRRKRERENYESLGCYFFYKIINQTKRREKEKEREFRNSNDFVFFVLLAARRNPNKRHFEATKQYFKLSHSVRKI